MWPARRRKSKKVAGDPRRKILLWAAVVGIVFSVTNIGEPLENRLHIWRDRMHPSNASGQIVLVGIDDRSVEKLGRWPWKRSDLAEIIDNLNASGARRIMLDINTYGVTDPVNDAALAAAIARAGSKMVLPTRFAVDPSTGKRTLSMPLSEFRKTARLGNINWKQNFAGEVWQMPYGLAVNGVNFVSMSAILGGVSGPSESWFSIDTSIRTASIPQISAVDVYQQSRNLSTVRGKDVIIAMTSWQLNDTYQAPGQGLSPGVFSHILAAETLRRGGSVDLNPLVIGTIMFICCLGLTYPKRRSAKIFAGSVAALCLTVLPLILETNRVYSLFLPGLVMVLIVAIGLARLSLKRKGATTNALSGLPNLNALRAISPAPGLSLIVARIHNFPEITSSLDPAMGRILVEQIQARVGLGIGDSKLYHGDEGIFAWFAQSIAGSDLGDQLGGLHALLTTPVAIDNRKVDLAVTFGIDSIEDRSLANRIGSALVAADEAAADGAKWKGYDPAKLKDAEWKLSLLGRLDEAIDNGEIWVAYQPKLDILTRRIVGAEALVRWSHPEKGMISPDEFIPVAEQHGRIEKLTLHVLDSAIRAAVAINARGIAFTVAVNLSARLLENPYLADTVSSHLQQIGLAPELLTLEITESAAMVDSENAVRLLHELRDHGINISIDDYGTGFSTLEYFKKIPATELKIDKGFVSLIDRSNSDRLMVNSTIQLAHELDRKVVAEGVETNEVLEALASMGCDQAQGYLISRPLRFPTLAKMLLRQRGSAAA